MSTPAELPKAVDGPITFLDDRLGSTTFFKRNMKKVFPDHWSFMLGEIALYSFIILLLTGTFLTLFFKPSMSEVVYHGSYHKLDGVKMSQAYESALGITFDVRGGLLMRQIHHWSAILFMAAIMAHMLRIFFTGAYRKPRELNWLIGLGLFTLGMVEACSATRFPTTCCRVPVCASPRVCARRSRWSVRTSCSSCSAASIRGPTSCPGCSPCTSC
jgi:ubiquinol-cytochrome c reductase cytochrome b subunit